MWGAGFPSPPPPCASSATASVVAGCAWAVSLLPPRLGEEGSAGPPWVGAECHSSRLLWPAPPPSESGEGHAGPGRRSSRAGCRVCTRGSPGVRPREWGLAEPVSTTPHPCEHAVLHPAPVLCWAGAGWVPSGGTCGPRVRAAWPFGVVPSGGGALPERDRIWKRMRSVWVWRCWARRAGVALGSPGGGAVARGTVEGARRLGPAGVAGAPWDRSRVWGGGIPWRCFPCGPVVSEVSRLPSGSRASPSLALRL